MTAWYLVRVRSRLTRVLYYLFVFSMVVPFQMVMYTLTYVVGSLGLDTVPGIVPVYLGFGAGLSVFMFAGFIKGVPLTIEEAAMSIPTYYEGPQVLHLGAMPDRAYYIPSSIPMDDLVEHRKRSDRFQLLSGVRSFHYYASQSG